MDKRNLIRNVSKVAISNLSTIISGVFVGLIIPKILTVDGYGYYKTFTLYASYLGLVSLGIIDGIVLKYGGLKYDELDKKMMRTVFPVYLIIHLIVGGIILLYGFSFGGEYGFIFGSLGLYLIVINISSYFQQLSQITFRFQEYSARKIIQSVLNVLTIIILFMIYRKFGFVSYKYYVASLIVVNAVLTLWYINTYKDIVFGEKYELIEKKRMIFSLIKNGFPLLFANLCATMILTIDRQFVNVLFDNTTYATYAFAYNMLALVTTATEAFSTVLYPSLKRKSKESIGNMYNILVTIVLIVIFFALVIYFPLVLIINSFLPNYISSLSIFQIIFPGLAISSIITIVMHNFYKTTNQNIYYFYKEIIVLLFSAVANGLAYLLFKSTYSISIASIFTMIFWFYIVEHSLKKEYKLDCKKNHFFMFLMIIVFYLTSLLSNTFFGCFLYVLILIMSIFILFRKELKNYIGKK